ncbi:MAG: redoxin domain-containing protein [Bacteroidia bacterium]
MSLQVGQTAPQFKSYDTEKKEINLSDFKGRPVVLLFFPFAFTSTCTAEMCSVRDDIAHYNKLNAEVIGISVDSLHSLKKYKAEQNLNFTLLSDFNKTISRDYDTIYETFAGWMHGVSKRSAFVVDKDGIIQYAEVLENAGEIPDLAAVKKVLENL